MRILKTLALSGAALVGATVVASAADLGPPPVGLPPPPMMAAAPVMETSGWYLRGDIGVGALDVQKFNYSDNDPRFVFQNKDFQHQFHGGIGVGYQVNSWFRLDLTGEYRGKTGWSTRDSWSNGPTDCSASFGQPAGNVFCVGNGSNTIRGNIASMVFLANAYLDLGTWNGLTPFIGVGIGMTQNKTTGISDNGFATTTVTASAAPPPAVGFATTSPTYGSANNGTKTNFAWAVMAGLAYDVTPNYKVELGYRYINLGKFETGTFNCPGGCGSTYTLQARQLDAHEFRLGMRWMLGGPSYGPAPMPIAEPRVIKKF